MLIINQSKFDCHNVNRTYSIYSCVHIPIRVTQLFYIFNKVLFLLNNIHIDADIYKYIHLYRSIERWKQGQSRHIGNVEQQKKTTGVIVIEIKY